MTKNIFELEKADVEQYMSDKGIKCCSLCNSKNTLEPVYDDDLRIVYKQSELLKYSEETNVIEHEMNSFEVLITCSNCGCLSAIAPGNIYSHLSLQK